MFKKLIKQLFRNLKQLAWPSRCVTCHVQMHHPIPICKDCIALMPWRSGPNCQQCGINLPTHSSTEICGECLSRKEPNHGLTICLFDYRFPADSLLRAGKYHDQRHYLIVMGLLMACQVRKQFPNHQLIQAVIPIPLHSEKYRQRGYNQAAELARHIARALKRPLLQNTLARKQNIAQAGSKAKTRKTNMHGAFVANELALKNIHHVLLIDDVYATGSTVNAATKALNAAGIKCVDRYCLLRTVFHAI